MQETDRLFAGSIPQIYDRYLAPLIFAPYARDLAVRVAAHPSASVLETAAGTGVATRALVRALPASTRIIATDLNQPMLDFAAARPGAANVVWRQAALFGAHAARLLRYRQDPRPDSPRSRSRRCNCPAGRRHRGIRPSASARARRCVPRSRRGDPGRLAEATEAAAHAVTDRFGDGPSESRMQAHIIVALR